MEAISVVILSGGKSSRMGKPKARLKIRNQTFVEYLADHLSAADEILFSVRSFEEFPEIPLKHIPDFYPGCGPLAGIHSALIHSRNPWTFIVACDSPFVSWDTVKTLYSYRSVPSSKEGTETYDAIIPIEEDGRLHATCGLYHKRMLPLIESLLEREAYRLRRALELGHTFYLPVNRFKDFEKIFCNINTMDDYKEVCR